MKFKIHALIIISTLIWLSLIDSKIVESDSLESQQYIDNMDGTITDSKTGLM